MEPVKITPTTPREELVALATSLGVEHAELLTRSELISAIERSSAPRKPNLVRPTSWFALARQLIASLVEQGLNMPDAAALIRGDAKLNEPPRPQPPVATVTLAKIYAAQGHTARALGVLEEVLENEPDHGPARELREKLHREQDPPSGLASDSAAVTEPTAVTGALRGPVASHAVEGVPSEDFLLVLQVSDREPVLVWELGRETEASRLAGTPIQIRWAWLTPAPSGPRRVVGSVPLQRASGAVPLGIRNEVDVRLVRACLGRDEIGRFVPLFTGPVVHVANADADPPSFDLGYAPRKNLRIDEWVRRALALSSGPV